MTSGSGMNLKTWKAQTLKEKVINSTTLKLKIARQMAKLKDKPRFGEHTHRIYKEL